MLGGSIGASFVASLCCIAPSVFIALGFGSFAAGAFFETLRPWFGTLAVVALATAWWRVFRQAPCGRDGCRLPASCNGAQIAVLSVATFLSLGLLGYPRIAALVLTVNGQGVVAEAGGEQIDISIPSMDCPACALGIQRQLSEQEGVRSVRITYETGLAAIVYDPGLISRQRILELIEATGFPPVAPGPCSKLLPGESVLAWVEK